MADEFTPRQKKVLKWKEFEREILDETLICTTDCKYYHRCPLAITERKKKEPACRVKGLSDEDLNRFLTFFVFEQDGLKDEAFKILFKIGQTLNLKDDVREMNIYLDTMMKIIRTFRIDPSAQGLDEPISIKITDYGQDLALNPESKVWREEGLVLQEDPESLVHSATLIDKFMTPPSQTSDGSRKRSIFVPKEELIKVKT